MLAKTSLTAVRALLELGLQRPGTCLSPRRLAESLGESPTYMAKVVRHMVKAGILEAEKGVKGGVRLLLAPEAITLQAVVEACHGAIIGNFCKSTRPMAASCSFHRATLELHVAVTGVLSRWTLADLLKTPAAVDHPEYGPPCLMARGHMVSVADAIATTLIGLGGGQ
ncbi:MAG: Rrf2 family transcriptional regulator [Bryobacterales bacterium]|nr:Rrf2 family transcriptional regulator [Bryobacterales bacterium]